MVEKDYLDYYKAFRLVKVSEPYKPYIKGEGWRWRALHGTCRLELITEAETMEEIVEQLPVFDLYYQVGYKNVKPFVFVNGLEFCSLFLRFGDRGVCYHVNGTRLIEGEQAFELIYESYDNEIVFVVSSWNAEKLTEMSLAFERGKEYHLYYELKIGE